MIILPTIYRPESLRRFVDSYQKTDATLPVYVILDSMDAFHYQSVVLPSNFKRCTVPPGFKLGEIFNLVFKNFPDEDFYGMVADDVVPETNRWDLILREACLPDKIAWGYDSIQNEHLPVHPFIGGNLVRRLGYWSAPGIRHWFVDNAWKDIADALECGVYMPEVRMVHKHYMNGAAQRDRTYESQPDPRADEIAYRMWKENEFPGIMRKLKAA